ncbi:transient receptor potential cation channel subfamily M member 1-like isoform X2 [Ostrea edulis]|uniref:transient receptor potential cation channel subfamily M member 1-like isoform X2 n=1 Tax=Ostrea edulis TaxID=37623 RepID=UPI0024AE95A2|nr:transient receptor potential cation channel subfamily M member 1-like isoform X2 [Ostrea edulis]
MLPMKDLSPSVSVEPRAGARGSIAPSPSTYSFSTLLDGLKNLRQRVVPDEKTETSWIEETFHKRECIQFIADPNNPGRCCCGRSALCHEEYTTEETPSSERWLPGLHTAQAPTDAFGSIEFQDTGHPMKAQYVRMATIDTKAESVSQLVQKHWGLELPKIIISVHGGIASFDLPPKLKRNFRKGVAKFAKTTGAWLMTNGIRAGFTRHVGAAIGERRSKQSKRKLVTFGFAPWGVVANKEQLVGRNKTCQYHHVTESYGHLPLDSRHSYFLLADNGTVGEFGAEVIFRRRIERYFHQQKITRGINVPLVCVVLEGGLNTIRAVLEYVTDTPPVPVIVCAESGRAADLISFAYRNMMKDGKLSENQQLVLMDTIQDTFTCTEQQAKEIYLEILMCVQRRNQITIVNLDDESQELDLTILIALLKGTCSSVSEQLRLALMWDRVDIAQDYILDGDKARTEESLIPVLMEALINDKVDFVKLLLENGVCMHSFLTVNRLEELYNIQTQCKFDPVRYFMKGLRKNIYPNYRYTLLDVGLVMDNLMGGAFMSSYSKKEFRQKYLALKRVSSSGSRRGLIMESYSRGDMIDADLFRYPYHDLMLWAVLMNRQKMALFMWQQGEEAMAKALVASKLYKAMAHEADNNVMKTDVSDKLMENSSEFMKLALEFLKHCYLVDVDYTQQLLTDDLKNFSNTTCLTVAVDIMHYDFVAHNCCQNLINDIWMGGLQTRKNSGIKVIAGILFPPFLTVLDYKSKKELKHMPQTAEEHLEDTIEDDSDDNDDNDNDIDDDSIQQAPSAQPTLPTSNSLPKLSDALKTNRKPPMIRSASMHFDNQRKISRQELRTLQKMATKNRECHMFHCRRTPVNLRKMIHKFYTAPITKFWFYLITYIMFLVAYSYTILGKTLPSPAWPELFVMVYILSFSAEKCRELLTLVRGPLKMKLRVFASFYWNLWDVAAIAWFSIGVVLRFYPPTLRASRIVYAMNIVFFNIRILGILSVNQALGAYSKIIGKLLKHMSYFSIIMFIVVACFGVVRQAVHFQNEEWSWFMVRSVFFYPYWMIYGEIFKEEIDTCFDTDNHNNNISWVLYYIYSLL